jgi:GT2 family glycosyltransferase
VVLDDLTSLVKRLQNGECYGIQPLILKLANMGIIDSAGDFIRRTKKMYEPQVKGAGAQLTKLLSDLHLEEVPSLRGAFMLVRKDAFLAVGGMDNTFIFNFEDVDLGWRMTCAGYTLLFDPHIKELHKGSRTTRAPELISEKVFRLGLLNLYALNLKINGFHLWPYIVIQFQRYMLLYEFAGVKTRRATAFKLIVNIFKMENCFFKRFQQARIHKSILSKKFKFRGRQKLERMTHGERFLRN